MNTKNNIFIDIITSFKGQQNIRAAKTDILGLTSAIKGLAAAYSVEQVVSKSLAAFKEQQSAVALLDNSLRNLGTSYQALQPVLDKQSEKMMNLGFTDNATIESITKLSTALGNPAKALEVLGTVADLARYNQEDLVTTSEKVAKAIAGQSKAFALLGLKIDKTLTPQNAFNKLLDQAKSKAGGAAEAYAKTLAGSLDIAAAKADNASEKLGKALAPSVQKLAEFATKYLVPVFSFLADHVSEIMAVAGALLAVAAAMKAVGVASAIASGKMALNPFFAGAAVLAFAATRIAKSKSFTPTSKANPSTGIDLQHMGVTPGSLSTTTADAASAVAKKKVETTKAVLTAEQILAKYMKDWNAQQAKADAAAIAAKNKQLALDKAAKALKDAGKVLDLQAIQINAALIAGKDTLSEKEKAVLLLQKALLEENANAATKLAEQVKTASEDHPFNKITEGANASKVAIESLTESVKAFGFASNSAWQSFRAGERGDIGSYQGVPTVPATPQPQTNVTVNVNGAMTHDELAKSIQDSINNNTASGSPSTYDRNKLVAF